MQQHTSPIIATYTPLVNGPSVQLADKRKVGAAGCGTIVIRCFVGDKAFDVPMHNVLHVPDLGASLLSLTTAMDSDYTIMLKGKKAWIMTNDWNVFAEGTLDPDSRLLYLDAMTIANADHYAATASTTTATIWHSRLGHIGSERLCKSIPLTSGLKIVGSKLLKRLCTSCVQGKQHITPINREPHVKDVVLWRTAHSDVCGPFVLSLGGSRYTVTFICEASSNSIVVYMKHKSEVFKSFKDFYTYIQKHHGDVKIFRSDNGGEYKSDEFLDFCRTNGILMKPSAPYSPFMNGIAERFNRELVEHTRCMLIEAAAPLYLWPEAMAYYNLIHACTYTSTLTGMTPYEFAHGKKPDISNFRVFGCVAYVLDPHPTNKLASKSIVCVYLRPEGLSGIHRLFNPVTRRIITSRNVVCDEHKMYYKLKLLGEAPTTAPSTQVRTNVGDDILEPKENSSNDGGDTYVTPNSVPRPVVDTRPGYDATPTGDATNRSDAALPGDAATTGDATSSGEASKRNVPPSINPIADDDDDIVTEEGGGRYPPELVADGDSDAGDDTIDDIDDVFAEDERYRSDDEEIFTSDEAPTKRVRFSEESHQPPPDTTISSNSSDNNSNTHRYPRRIHNPPGRFSSFLANQSSLNETCCYNFFAKDYQTVSEEEFFYDYDEPKTYEEAISGPEAKFWIKAIDDELNALRKRTTFGPKGLCPEGKIAIDSKWVFKKKRDAQGKVVRYKARLCAKGFTQVQGIDFEETYTPVARLNSIRTLLAIALKEGLDIYQLDIDSAYLYGDIDAEIYLRCPQGMDALDDEVVQLLKALYGLRQAGKIWYHVLAEELTRLGFTVSQVDKCIYVSRQTEHGLILIAIYVDDIVAVCTKSGYDYLCTELRKKFELKTIGLANWILGIQIIRDGDTIKLSQRAYLAETLKMFGMTDCKPSHVPSRGGDINIERFGQHDDDAQPALFEAPTVYRRAVGRLMYAMVSTRPDICFSVILAARFMAYPTVEAWRYIKRLLRYVAATLDYGLVCKSNPTSLVGYCDSDWAGDIGDRRSVSGYVVSYGGMIISWGCKKQTTVALSSTEAEYMSISDASKELLWVRALLASIGYPENSATTLHIDNKSAIALTSNPRDHRRTKHIDIRFHFIRQQILDNVIAPVYIETRRQVADILTKPLNAILFKEHRDAIGVNVVK